MPSGSKPIDFESLRHAHTSRKLEPKPKPEPLSLEARRALFAGKTPAVHQDPERRLFADCGPHEIWDEDPDAEQEAAQAKAKLERLEQADAAASELDGVVTNAPTGCARHEDTRALEVELRDAAGPVRGVAVALQRAEPAGVLTAKSDAQGLVRFEGLRPAESHQLVLPTLAPAAWKITATAALPPERATCHHVATWPAPSKSDAGFETRHVVAPGECMWTLAHDHGYDQDTLWAANAALKEQGRLPNVLAPGDVVVLPAKDAPKHEDARPGTRVTIEVTAVLPRARLWFQDAEGKPRSGLGFVARVVTTDGTEQVWEGTTDGSGGLDESVPADSRTLTVVLKVEPEPQPFHFRFGHLDPLKTISGVQGRLLNLGYPCDKERGELGPVTRRSLRDFQAEHELPSTGKDDDATRGKVETLYDK